MQGSSADECTADDVAGADGPSGGDPWTERIDRCRAQWSHVVELAEPYDLGLVGAPDGLRSVASGRRHPTDAQR